MSSQKKTNWADDIEGDFYSKYTDLDSFFRKRSITSAEDLKSSNFTIEQLQEVTRGGNTRFRVLERLADGSQVEYQGFTVVKGRNEISYIHKEPYDPSKKKKLSISSFM